MLLFFVEEILFNDYIPVYKNMERLKNWLEYIL